MGTAAVGCDVSDFFNPPRRAAEHCAQPALSAGRSLDQVRLTSSRTVATARSCLRDKGRLNKKLHLIIISWVKSIQIANPCLNPPRQPADDASVHDPTRTPLVIGMEFAKLQPIS